MLNNVPNFIYDPENGQIFDTWYKRYEDLFLIDAAILDDDTKVRILVRKLDGTAHERYVNFILQLP